MPGSTALSEGFAEAADISSVESHQSSKTLEQMAMIKKFTPARARVALTFLLLSGLLVDK
jgi:hypothetical protein